MEEFKLSNYEVLTQSGSGWHKYLRADVTYLGKPRKLVIFFESKSDEELMSKCIEITVRGKVVDQDSTLSLLLQEPEIIHHIP